MKGYIYWILLFLMFLPVMNAEEMKIDITLSKNDLVSEHISIITEENYDIIQFTTIAKPLSIIYDGEYSINPSGDYYIIEFPAKPRIDFTLVFDDFIDRGNRERVFRTSFYPESQILPISVTLPASFVLSDKEPNAIPRPDGMTTDGKKITLSWILDGDADISVFYQGEGRQSWIIFTSLLFIIFIGAIIFWFFRKTANKKIIDTLSSEEIKVMEELKKGGKKQNHVAKTLNFSKSKMSKIVRKLEEKKLIVKEPYFNTNIIKKK